MKNIVKPDTRESEVVREHRRHLRILLKKAKDEGNIIRILMLQLILLAGEGKIVIY